MNLDLPFTVKLVVLRAKGNDHHNPWSRSFSMSSAEAISSQFDKADRCLKSQDFAEAEIILKKLLSRSYDTDTELREHERALTTLGTLYKTQK